MTSNPTTILIAPVGALNGIDLERVAEPVREVFGFQTECFPLIEDVSFAFHQERQQYHSTPILERLSQRAPERAVKVAAVTAVDLFIPILTYVFGEAQLNGRSCLVSIHRLKDELPALETERTLARRLAKETLHELGHTFNLRHCPDPACLMHYCRHAKDIDRKSNQFCRYCRVLLTDSLRKMPQTGSASQKPACDGLPSE